MEFEWIDFFTERINPIKINLLETL